MCNRIKPVLALLLVEIIIGSVSSAELVEAPQLSTAPEYYYARYRINGTRPKSFETVAYLVLGLRHSPSGKHNAEEQVKYDEQGNAFIRGEVWTGDGISFQFETARLIRSTTLLRDGCGLFVELSAMTKTIGVVKYSFRGEFLKRPERLGQGDYTDLRGVITKYVSGQKIGQANVDFTKLGVE